MTVERKILIVLGVIVLALAVFGFEEVERYDYSDRGGPGFGKAVNAPGFEYAVTRQGGGGQGWGEGQGRGEGRGNMNIEGQLNSMGSQGWELVAVQQGGFSEGYVFFFKRPVAQWR